MAGNKHLLPPSPWRPPPLPAYQISVEHPVGVEVMDAVQDLVEQGFHHSPGQLQGLLVGLGRSVELDYVLWTDRDTHVRPGCDMTMVVPHE